MDKSRLTLFERSVAYILALLHLGLGLYYAGPWYITESSQTATGIAPTLDLLPSETFVHGYGWVLMASSIFMGYATWRGSLKILGWALLSNFLLRTYHFIGTIAAMDSFIPPSWASRGAVILILGAFWIWVRHRERVTE